MAVSKTTNFSLVRDINGYNGFGLDFAWYNKTAQITVGLAASYTVPSNFQNWIAIFGIEPGASVWVALNATAAVPVGATFADSTSELNPVGRFVQAGDVISCITPDATANVSISLYAIGNYS